MIPVYAVTLASLRRLFLFKLDSLKRFLSRENFYRWILSREFRWTVDFSRDPFIVAESLDKGRMRENAIRVGDRIEAASSENRTGGYCINDNAKRYICNSENVIHYRKVLL